MSEETGGPAFPQVDLRDHYGMFVPDRQAGMTLRDYFAAKALEACFVDDTNIHGTARLAYAIADAMLKAREQ